MKGVKSPWTEDFWSSVQLGVDHRVEFLELDAGLPVGELPVNGGSLCVAFILQRPHPLL